MNTAFVRRAFAGTMLLFASAHAAYALPAVSLWKGEGASFSINGQAVGYSRWLGVVIQKENDVCAVEFQAFAGHETVHLYRGKFMAGRSELLHTRRIRGEMNPTPQMELYEGRSLMVQRIYVYGDTAPRSMLLEPFDGEAFQRSRAEVLDACAS